MILLKDKIIPYITPYLSIACLEYSEQVGLNLQEPGKKGEITF